MSKTARGGGPTYLTLEQELAATLELLESGRIDLGLRALQSLAGRTNGNRIIPLCIEYNGPGPGGCPKAG